MKQSVVIKLSQRVVVVMLSLFVLTGCESKLKPDTTGVLDYLDNAAWHGNVYRLWPEGQAYVDNVLAARSELLGTLAPLQPYFDFTHLWTIDSPDWRDVDKVQAEVEKATLALENGMTQAQFALKKLDSAIHAIPAGIDKAPSAFAEDVWSMLKGDGYDLREEVKLILAPVRLYIEVLKSANERSDELDPAGTGLQFVKGSASEEITTQYAELLHTLQGVLDSRIDTAHQGAMQFIALREAFIAEIGEEDLSKEQLRMVKREKATLKNKVKQYSDYLTSVRRKFLERAETADRKLKALEESTVGKDDSKLVYLKNQVEQTAKQHEQYGAKITEMLKEIKEAEMAKPGVTPAEPQQ